MQPFLAGACSTQAWLAAAAAAAAATAASLETLQPANKPLAITAGESARASKFLVRRTNKRWSSLAQLQQRSGVTL